MSPWGRLILSLAAIVSDARSHLMAFDQRQRGMNAAADKLGPDLFDQIEARSIDGDSPRDRQFTDIVIGEFVQDVVGVDLDRNVARYVAAAHQPSPSAALYVSSKASASSRAFFSIFRSRMTARMAFGS